MLNHRSCCFRGVISLAATLACLASNVSYGALVSAVLPTSRSAQSGTTVTAFATVINTGPGTAVGCSITPATVVPAAFAYQTTDPATNVPVGTPNTPVDIAEGAGQSFVFAFTPSVPFAPTEVELTFDCANTSPAASISGLNTFLLSSSSTPVPDIVALAATPTGDGIVNLPGSFGANAFAVASVNVGSQGMITASAETGTAPLPLILSICETNPATAECLSAPATTVTTSINAGATPTFSVFVMGNGTVPFDPANNRIFVRFKDAGGVTRGATSVALRTGIACGEIITQDTTLHADLVCPGDAPFAIEFGAAFITLDLDGHSIVGQAGIGDNVARGVTATEKHGITIRNGTIEGFDEAIFLSLCNQATVSNMTFQLPHGVGVNARLITELVVEDSLFNLPLTDIPTVEANGVAIYGGSAHIRNIVVNDGMVGVAFGFAQACDTAQSPSNGTIVNNSFSGTSGASVYVTCSTDARVAGNNIEHGVAIVGEGPFFGAVTGLRVEDNVVINSGLGIQLRGVTESTVTRNRVNDSVGWGIAATRSLGCDGPLPGWDCFYSTANLISENVALGNSPDLYHDAGSTGNTWVNNTCVTKIGADIPDC